MNKIISEPGLQFGKNVTPIFIYLYNVFVFNLLH